MTQQGGCLCGNLRFEVDEKPLGIINCFCKFCQRATGSDYLAESLFKMENFRLNKGDAAAYQHQSAGSGKTVTVNFCAACGTKLYLAFERFPEIVGVFSGAFDDNNWLPRNAATTCYMFLTSAPDGVVLAKEHEAFHEHCEELDGRPRKPLVFQDHTVVTQTVRDAARAFAAAHRDWHGDGTP